MSRVRTEIEGNIGYVGELRFVGEKQTPVINFSVAVPSRERNAEGKWVDMLDLQGNPVVNWKNCEAWNSYARNIANSLRKGVRVKVIGEELMDKGFNRDDGTFVPPRVKVRANSVSVDLMFNTVTVNDNRDGGNSQSGGGGNNNQSSAPAQNQGANQNQSQPAAAQDPLANLNYGDDDNQPPF